jgi:hypothetical protein
VLTTLQQTFGCQLFPRKKNPSRILKVENISLFSQQFGKIHFDFNVSWKTEKLLSFVKSGKYIHIWKIKSNFKRACGEK